MMMLMMFMMMIMFMIYRVVFTDSVHKNINCRTAYPAFGCTSDVYIDTGKPK